MTEQERAFLQAFREKAYKPELLFADDAVLARISGHPMALWKCGDQSIKAEHPTEDADKPSILERLYAQRTSVSTTDKAKRKKDLER